LVQFGPVASDKILDFFIMMMDDAKAINEHIKQKDIFSFHKGSSLIN
jgi:hypothetical protein